MKFKCNSTDPVPPVEIILNDDVQFFLHENLSGIAYRTPLCVTYQCRLITPILQANLSEEDNQYLNNSWEESQAYPTYRPSTYSNEAVETNRECEISHKHFSPRFNLPQKMYLIQSPWMSTRLNQPLTILIYLEAKLVYLQAATPQVLMMHINVSTTL